MHDLHGDTDIIGSHDYCDVDATSLSELRSRLREAGRRKVRLPIVMDKDRLPIFSCYHDNKDEHFLRRG